LENYNAYNEAKEEFESQKVGEVSSVVSAEIDKIRAEIRKSTIPIISIKVSFIFFIKIHLY
jgi:hypothetical protein